MFDSFEDEQFDRNTDQSFENTKNKIRVPLGRVPFKRKSFDEIQPKKQFFE